MVPEGGESEEIPAVLAETRARGTHHLRLIQQIIKEFP